MLSSVTRCYIGVSSSLAIDPSPYNKVFSPALDHLLALQKQVATKTRRLEEEMKIAERDYAGRLRDMHGDFDVSTDSQISARLIAKFELCSLIGGRVDDCFS